MLTGAVVAAGCMLGAWAHFGRYGARVSNEHYRRIAIRQLSGAGLGGFTGGTVTGLSIAAAGLQDLAGFAMLGAIFALSGALGVALVLQHRHVPSLTRAYFQETFLAALGFSGPWLVLYVWIACQ
jgi:hypothetical protein